MKKNDKIIAVVGVVMLLLASLGILLTVPTGKETKIMNANELYQATGSIVHMPDTITVSDSCPFYPLVATPLAVHYDANGMQNVIPLYIENLEKPSTAVTKVKYQLDVLSLTDFVIDDSMDAKEISLEIAKYFWESSEAALIIEYNESGYNLGVIATPIASYLSIPVIVTDEIDEDVQTVLNELGVEKTIICGENLGDYGYVLRFETVEEIVDFTMDMLFEKFGEIDYLTITNPIDAWPPEVLDSEEFTFGPEYIKSTSFNKFSQAAMTYLTGGGSVTWDFKIPSDYKYTKIKFEGVNHNYDEADELGDAASFNIGPNLPELPGGLQKFEVLAGGSTGSSGVAERDSSGQITKDMVYAEAVLYDRGNVEYHVDASGAWAAADGGEVSATVVVEKLDSPLYEPMKALSSIAPYLTAYHKGLIFGKPDFAFAADDDVINDEGNTCPGLYMPRKNPDLVPISNRHIYDNIHVPINEILAKLADISLDDDRDIESLRNYYASNPVYVTLVGGATALPNYIYQNHAEPVGDIDGDGVDDTPWFFGAGTPSDVIYGNIDPIKYDWSNQANDIYTEYPFMENIIGRITGWDAQDASALIARNIFYTDIVEQLNEWRDNFAVMVGGGQDFQRVPIRYAISKFLGKSDPDSAVKLDTGYAKMTLLRTADEVAEPMDFNVFTAFEEQAMRQGYTDEAIEKLKTANLWNILFMRETQLRRLAGEGKVIGGDLMESSNFIMVNGHGQQHFFGMAGNKLSAAGFGGLFMQKFFEQTMVPILGGFIGPGGNLGDVGDYTCRGVENMDFGPSFVWIESCVCGKIDGVYPKTSAGQAFLHAGTASLIAAPTGSNIGGGYLEPKKRANDRFLPVTLRYLKAQKNWKNGIYEDPHFGFKIYTDLCDELKENDCSIGLAFRDARNNYFSQDEVDWEVWWTPPLVDPGNAMLSASLAKGGNADFYKTTSSGGLNPRMDAKYVTYQEYLLFGDPALNPYEPCNEGE